MSDVRRPHIYPCPYIDSCICPIDEEYFKTYCREYSAVAKHPQHEQCTVYSDMSRLPRSWHSRLYKQTQDIGQAKARYRT